jgi:hypothetical protein
MTTTSRLLGNPLQVQPALGLGTIPEVEIDQSLVGNASFFGDGPEVLDYVDAETDRKGFAQFLGVRIAG